MNRFIVMLCCTTLAIIAAEPPPPAVHLQRGLWSHHYRLEEGLARMGGALVAEGYAADSVGFGWPGHGTQGNRPRAFWLPSREAMKETQIIVLANLNPQALKDPEALIAWVHDGGGLLILGGRFALGKAHRDSPLAALTPADFAGEGPFAGSDLVATPQGLTVQPVDHFQELDWTVEPRLYWHHTMTPKPGSETWLTAGDSPLLTVGAYGKGRVAVFAGTVMGVEPDGQTPFWRWSDWPAVLAQTLAWLAEPALAIAAQPKPRATADNQDEIEDLIGDLTAAGNNDGLPEREEPVMPREAARRVFEERRVELRQMGDDGELEALLRETRRLEPLRTTTPYPDRLSLDDRLYQLCLLARLQAGDAAVAPAIVDAILETRYVIARARTEQNKPENMLELVRRELPDVLAWEQTLYRELNRLPVSALPPLAEAMAAATDPRLGTAALAMAAGRPLPADVLQHLSTSPVPAIAALSEGPLP